MTTLFTLPIKRQINSQLAAAQRSFGSSLQQKATQVLRGVPKKSSTSPPVQEQALSSTSANNNTGKKSPVISDDLSKELKTAGSISDDLEKPSIPSLAATINLHEFAPRICVIGVGGGGGNALNNMIANKLSGVDFLALNTDAQHLNTTLTDNRIQLGTSVTDGLGCGANPDAGRAAAVESKDEILDRIGDAHMCFITAGMGGGTGTGAAPVIAELCYQNNILTVGVVSTPFRFEGKHRMRTAQEGIDRLRQVVDSIIVVPNQNLYRIIGPNDSLVDSLEIANNILLNGVRSVTDLMTRPGQINVDFADVCAVMHGMGNAIIGTGVASGEDRAEKAAKEALHNPLLGDELDISSAKGLLVNITGGRDLTLHEFDQASTIITDVIDEEYANIIIGSAYDDTSEGSIRISLVATGIDGEGGYVKSE